MEQEPGQQHLLVAKEDAHQGEDAADDVDHIEHDGNGQVQSGILMIKANLQRCCQS